MTLDNYRTTLAWHEALDLAPHLVRIAEQLPDGESAGLGARLRMLSTEIPGSIAADLVTGSQTALQVALHTAAALEVIEHVYPALDTAVARSATDELAARVQGPNFAEQPAVSLPPEIADATNAAVDAVEAAPVSPVAAATDFAAATPVATVQLTPDAAAPVEPPVASVAPTSVSVSTETTDVHPDSPQ